MEMRGQVSSIVVFMVDGLDLTPALSEGRMPTLKLRHLKGRLGGIARDL